MKDIIQRLDEYIEFANSTKKLSDVGFYEDAKTEIQLLRLELSDLKRSANEGSREFSEKGGFMNIEDGWRFSTADFSIIAGGGKIAGSVMLIRSPENLAKWMKLPDEIKEPDDCPPLHISGRGMTFEEAVCNANLKAAHALPINV